jgi:hypothetical protein
VSRTHLVRLSLAIGEFQRPSAPNTRQSFAG